MAITTVVSVILIVLVIVLVLLFLPRPELRGAKVLYLGAAICFALAAFGQAAPVITLAIAGFPLIPFGLFLLTLGLMVS